VTPATALLISGEPEATPELLRAQPLDGNRFLACGQAVLQGDSALRQVKSAREQRD
jgi:hypothetical protein